MKTEDKYSNEADDYLSDLLRKIDLQEPSDQFVDQVIKVYDLQKGNRSFRLLKVPLFLMGGLGLFLLLPWMISMAEIMSNNPNPQLLGLIQDLSFDFSVLYLVCPLVLLLSLAVVVLIEMRSITFHKTNRPVI